MNYSAFAAAASSTSTFVGTLPPANGAGSVETRVTPSFLRPSAKSPSCFGRSLICHQGFNLRSRRIPGFATKGQRTVCAPFATATTEKSVHNFTVKDIDGNDIFLNKFKGKVLLIVNVASKCGFTTSNYTELSHLYDVYKNQGFEVLAFPCNQFGGQEPGSNPEIKRFACTKFKAEFPIFDKVDVNGPNSAPLYEFLKASTGGFLGNLIKWNFEKFLINKNGKVVERYSPTTSPFQMEKVLAHVLEEAGYSKDTSLMLPDFMKEIQHSKKIGKVI
ncbi:hypothetical protein KSP39_PZI020961 [Platanthera zijinensis]|uniref:Glutathione peroxidase n=1 Tax=Platanthera zijinensis TaxID=2320716 RepID=A0AAP0AXE4_9ASPA